MDVAAVKALCGGFPAAASKLVGPAGNVRVYSMAATSERFLGLTGVSGINRAHYMGCYRWVTIVDACSVPTGYLKELITWLHGWALAGLSKRRQAEIVARAPKPRHRG